MRPAPIELTKQYSQNEQQTLNETSRQVLARIQPMKTQVLGNAGVEDVVWGVPVSLRNTGK